MNDTTKVIVRLQQQYNYLYSQTGGSHAVTSFNTRIGAVVPLVGDYSGFYYPLSSNPSSYLTANQSISFAPTGDVTGSTTGTTSLAPAFTIGANIVSYAKFQQVAGVSLVGNPTGSAANAQGITLGAALAFSGTALQTAALSGDVTTSANSFATTIASGVVTYAKLQTIVASSLIGNATGGTATATAITLGATFAFSGTALQTVAMTGDITTSANSFATTLATNIVTYAKFQQVAASSLVGNATGSLANATGITLGSTLSFSASALQTVAISGDVTSSANSFATTLAANIVTYAKFQQVAASSLVGNATGSLANATGITLGAALTFSGSALQTVAMSGDITTAANSFATTIANNAVTYAKFVQPAANSLVGNPTGSQANAINTGIDSTLQFASNNLGIKLSTSNTWSAIQTIQTTTANQLSVNYDGSHTCVYSMDSTGKMTVTTTNGYSFNGGAVSTGALTIGSASNIGWSSSSTGRFIVSATVTAAGTTGAQTISKQAGTVNFAAGASAITVTNTLVTTSSIIFGVIRFADSTATFIKSIVPGTGSFVITLNATATAETSVGWMLVNT